MELYLANGWELGNGRKGKIISEQLRNKISENTKKGFKDMNTISVLLTDLGYKSFKPAVDSFYGPINII